jgi:glyoxylate/hydroxypyruvate reductase A
MALLFVSSVDSAEEWRAELGRRLPDVEMRVWPELGNPEDIEVALVWRPPPGLLAQLPKLKLIAVLGAGVDHLFADPQLPAVVPIVRLVDPYMTVAMSEYVQLQVLRLHCQDVAYLAQQRRRQWRPLAQPTAAERRIGVLGLGVLGSDAALKLKVLGFDVAGWSRTPKNIRGIACFQGGDGLSALLTRSDILVCLLPLTPETEGILDTRLFAKLPRGASIVNCARGAHLIERDLLAALDSGQISAAVLDVFRDEPLPADHPFWGDGRIIITPHVAAATQARTAAIVIADNISRLRDGKSLRHQVSVSKGY